MPQSAASHSSVLRTGKCLALNFSSLFSAKWLRANVLGKGPLSVVVEGVEKLGDKCYFRVLRLYAAPDKVFVRSFVLEDGSFLCPSGMGLSLVFLSSFGLSQSTPTLVFWDKVGSVTEFFGPFAEISLSVCFNSNYESF